MPSTELEKSNCKAYHAPENADDLLIVQKAIAAVPSASTSKTVLVGEDTDLIVLLCHHASLDSHDLFFRPESKKNTKSFTFGTSGKAWSRHLQHFLSMLFLGVTQHHVFMGLERGCPLGSSKQAVLSMVP